MDHLVYAHAFLSQIRWRLPLLVLYLIVAAAGYYAFKCEQKFVSLFSVSRDNSKFSAMTDGDFVVISADGRILHRISAANMRGHYGEVHWTADGDLVFLSSKGDYERIIAKLELGDDGRVERHEFSVSNPVCVFCSRSGHIVHVEQGNDENGRFLRIVEDLNRELNRIEFGAKEDITVRARPSPNGSVCIAITANAESGWHVFGEREFVLTDGKCSTTVVLNPDTGQQILSLRSDRYGYVVLNSRTYIATMRKSGLALVALSDLENAIIEDIPMAAMMVGEHRLIAPNFDQIKGRMQLQLHDMRNPGVHSSVPLTDGMTHDAFNYFIDMPPYCVLPFHTGTMLYADPGEGRVTKFDLDTHQQEQLFTVRPWYLACFQIAVLGLPITTLLWLWFAYRRPTISPMVEVLIGVSLGCVVCVAWSSVAGESQLMLRTPTLVLFAAMVCLVLIWAANSRSLIGHGIPILVFGLASALWLYNAWDRDNNEFKELSAAVVLAGGMAVGLLVVRRVFGRLVNPESENVETAFLGKISLTQCMLVTFSIAVYIALTRELGVRFVPKVDGAIFSYGVYAAIAACLAYSIAVSVRKISLGIPLVLVVVFGLLIGFDYSNLGAHRNWLGHGQAFFRLLFEFKEVEHLPLHPHLHVAYAALLVFLMSRYCLACGLRMTK